MVLHVQPITLVIFGIFFTGLFCLINGIYFILSPKTESGDIFITLFLFFEAAWLGLGGLAAMEFAIISSVFLFKLSLLFYFFAILSINFYFHLLITPDFRLRWYHFLNAIGPLFVVILFFIEKDPSGPVDFLSLYYQGGGTILLSTVTSVTLFFYFIITLFRSIRVFKGQISKLSSSWLRIFIFFILNIILTVLWIVDKIFHMGYLWHLYFISGCFPIFASFILIEDPEFLRRLVPGYDRKQYVKTRIGTIDIDSTLYHIDAFMRSEKPYRDSGLSLKGLAVELDLSSHQLSELLNVHLQKNFFSFVNFYRVEEAKDRICAEPDIQFINIAFDAGFQSIASFNRIFKKEVGISPSAYRKSQNKLFSEKDHLKLTR